MPNFIEIPECDTCGIPAKEGFTKCQVCGNKTFSIRYFCISCERKTNSQNCSYCSKSALNTSIKKESSLDIIFDFIFERKKSIKKPRKILWKTTVLWMILLLFIPVGIYVLMYFISQKKPETIPINTNKILTPNTPATAEEFKVSVIKSQLIITPNQAREWEGKEASLRFIIKSTYDGFDWGFLIYSEENRNDPKNFTVIIDKEDAKKNFQLIGINNLKTHFSLGKLILVSGRIEKYVNKKTGLETFQIKITNPKQVKIY